jgi:hypothetical protein
VHRIRSGRRGSRLWRPAGLLLIAVAVAAALDPEYPLPRLLPTHTSAAEPGPLVPDPVSPRGAMTGDAVRFVWRADGEHGDGPAPALYIVVLDEQLEAIGRFAVQGGDWVPQQALAARLRSGAQFHWQIEAVAGAERRRSAPAAFQFLH